jgi:signal transduction histidine kinase/thiol-disulfide isomerase/thioredoxin
MRAIGSLRRRRVELGWGVFAAANLVAMGVWPNWETIPFHFVWISLTLVYGFRVWRARLTATVLAAVAAATGSLILVDAFEGIQLWGELFEVPLMSAMFLAMVWHARRRQEALATAERRAAENARLLARQERFLHDASHELRTPVTIARGHLELALRGDGRAPHEIEISLDELGRMDRIVERLLLLAKADLPDFIVKTEVDLEPFLEDVLFRWSEIAPRAWRLGPIAQGVLTADPEGLRAALDAVLENAVKYTEPRDAIELRARAAGREVVIEVADGGTGFPAEDAARIFERFARADPSRARVSGGAGLGLAIVDAIVRAHGGEPAAEALTPGSLLTLRLPGFEPAGSPDRRSITTEPLRPRLGSPLAAAPRARLALRAAALIGVAALLAVLVFRFLGGTGAQLSPTTLRGRPRAPALDLGIIWRSTASWPPGLRRLAERPRLSIRSLRGRPTVVNFWASWCDPCKRELPRLIAAAKSTSGRVVFLGVDLNDFTGDARGFLKHFQLNYVSVHGGGETAQRYGLIGLPETYYLDAAGRVVDRTTGEVSRGELERGIARASSQ